jgi:hypothetical protein
MANSEVNISGLENIGSLTTPPCQNDGCDSPLTLSIPWDDDSYMYRLNPEGIKVGVDGYKLTEIRIKSYYDEGDIVWKWMMELDTMVSQYPGGPCVETQSAYQFTSPYNYLEGVYTGYFGNVTVSVSQ